jgi:hypothetical protein
MADVTKSVLFTVGTIGTAVAGQKFSDLHKKMLAVSAGIGLVSAGLLKLVADSQAFGESFKSVTTDMSDFNKQTNGMINTLDGLQGTVKLQTAGLHLTAEQLGAIGSAAASMSQSLGEGPEGATTRFNKLVKAVIKGSEGPLLEYGIQIDEQTDKVVAQAEVVDKLTEAYGGLVVQVQTAEQKMFAVKNSFDTVMQSEIDTFLNTLADDWRDIGIEIMGGVDAMQQFETEILQTGGAIVEWEQSWDGFFNKVDANMKWIAVGAATLVAGPLGALVATLAVTGDNAIAKHFEIIKLEAELERAQIVKQQKAAFEKKNLAIEIAKVKAETEALRRKKLLEAKIKKNNLRTGTKVQDTVDYEFGLGEVDAYNANLDPNKLIADTNRSLRVKSQIESEVTHDVSGAAAGQAAMEARAKINKLKQDQERNHLAVMLGLNKEAIDQQMRWQQMTADQRVKVLETTTSESTQILSNFAQAADSETKAGFEAQKKLMYSANILSTIQGAAGAFARVMSSMPAPASFIVAPIAAASVVTAGAAAGKKIRSAKFGGNANAKAPSTPNFSGGSLGASTGGGGDSFTFNVNVEGQTVFSSVMNANDMANQNGQRSFSTGQ